jgi:peptide/nickel transport system substrate-binding protein
VFATERDLTEALRAGGIDGALYGERILPETLDFFGEDDRWTASSLPAAPYYMLYLDTRAPMFSDREVRTAFFQGINRSSLLADVAGNRGVVAGTGVPEGTWADSSAEFPPFSPGVAAATLEVEGFFRGRDGTRSNSSNVRLAFALATSDEPRHVAVAENIAAQLRQIGVTVTVEPYPAATFIQNHVIARDYEAALVMVNPGVDPDPYPFWHSSQIPAPGLNLANYREARIDDAIERGRQTTDIERRRDLYQLFDGYFIAAMPSIPLFAPSFAYVQASGVQGFEPRLLFRPSDRFAGIQEWFVRTRVAD